MHSCVWFAWLHAHTNPILIRANWCRNEKILYSQQFVITNGKKRKEKIGRRKKKTKKKSRKHQLVMGTKKYYKKQKRHNIFAVKIGMSACLPLLLPPPWTYTGGVAHTDSRWRCVYINRKLCEKCSAACNNKNYNAITECKWCKQKPLWAGAGS